MWKRGLPVVLVLPVLLGPAAAADSLQRCVEPDPTKLEACERLAWLLAMHPDSSVRRGSEAVELAEPAYRSMPEPTPRATDVLATAHAEAGRFEEAIRAAETAGSLATAAGEQDLAAAIRERIRTNRVTGPGEKVVASGEVVRP